MPRIYFTDESLSQLKTTLTNSIYILHTFIWQEMSHKIYSEFDLNPDPEKVSSAIEVEPFKPQRTKFYDSISKILGYKNWKELNSASKPENSSLAETTFVYTSQALRTEIKKVYTDAFHKQFNPSEAGGFKDYFFDAVDFYCGLVVDAMVLNPTDEPVYEVAIANNNVHIGVNGVRTPSENTSFQRDNLYPTHYPVPNLVNSEVNDLNDEFHDFFEHIITAQLDHISMLAKYMLLSQSLSGGYMLGDQKISSEYDFSSQYKLLGGVIKLGVVLEAFAQNMGTAPLVLMEHVLRPESKKELQEGIFMLSSNKS